MRFLFVHGGWQGGWCWDQVAQRLRAQGHETHTPTLLGLEADLVTRKDVLASEMAEHLVAEIRRLDLTELVLVGHSGGGPIGQLVHELVPERLARLVFVDAWVLLDGERVYDVLPAPLAESLQAAAAASPERMIPMPLEFWRAGLLNDLTPEQADRWLERVVPCPDGWMSEPLRLSGFAHSRVPTSYVFLDDDLSVPRETFQNCADRLHEPVVTSSPGSHEAMLSQPGPLADALLRVCA